MYLYLVIQIYVSAQLTIFVRKEYQNNLMKPDLQSAENIVWKEKLLCFMAKFAQNEGM